MTIGLSTYAFFWQWHDTATSPLSLTDMIEKTAEWDVKAELNDTFNDKELDHVLKQMLHLDHIHR